MSAKSDEKLDATEDMSGEDKAEKNVLLTPSAMHVMSVEIMNYFKWNVKNINSDQVTTSYIRFNPELHLDCDDHRAPDWLFLLNTLNFSLWSKNATQWTVNGLTGYHALAAAIKRAIDEDQPIWDPNYYSQLTQLRAEIIFRSDDKKTDIPFLERRLEILHQIGETLVNQYRGTFVEFLKSCEGDPKVFILFVSECFDSYKDVAVAAGKTARFYTKARMLLHDMWFYFENYEFGLKFDLGCMTTTMLIDYRVLQVLHHFKILRYSEELAARFRENDSPLLQGSKEEVEIRFAIAKIAKEVHSNVQEMYKSYLKKTEFDDFDFKCVAILIDNFLWDYRQTHDQLLKETVPFHNIYCDQY